MTATPWFTPGEGFQLKLEVKNDIIEHHWGELYVGWHLLTEGFTVTVPKVKIAQSQEEMEEFTEQKDVLVGHSGVLHVEVKTQTDAWHGPEDFKHPGILLSKVHRYEARQVKPLAHAVVSKPTGAMIVVFDDTKPFWHPFTSADPHGQINTNWRAPRSCFRTFDDLVEYLTMILDEQERLG